MQAYKKILLTFALVLIFSNEIEKCSLAEATPLDDYVNQPDSHYKWDLIQTYDNDSFTIYILNMTSQKWLDETVTTKPIWWHYLNIVIPKKVLRPDAAFLFIEGGSTDNGFVFKLFGFI